MAWPAPGSNPAAVAPSWPRAVYPYATPENVSTERPLLVLTELGRYYEDLSFTVWNHDEVHDVAVWVDHAESASSVNVVRDQITVPAGKEATLPFRNILDLFWGLSAAGDPNGGFPTCSVSWTIVGKRRPSP